MKTILISTAEAAKKLGVSSAFLEKQRRNGDGIPYVKLSRRAVRYKVSDIESFIKERTRTSTAEV